MTGNKIITVHSKRRGRSKHRTKRKAPKQSDDYHDGRIINKFSMPKAAI